MLSYDYDLNNPLTQEFFATVQNKMLYAVTGKTAAELIQSRANSTLPNMGLTTWKGAARGRVLTRSDITIAKNYLNREEMSDLELLVGQYLDFAEFQARRKKENRRMIDADGQTRNWRIKYFVYLREREGKANEKKLERVKKFSSL